LRYDEVTQEATSNRAQDKLQGAGGEDSFDSTDSAVTGRLGALYRISDTWAPFASYSESFAPVGVKVSGDSDELLDPTEGRQVEAGLKFSALNQQLSGTLAAYRIDRENVPIQDPDNPNRQVNGGEQRSQGVELDLAGRPVDQLQLMASLGYTDAEIVESTQVEDGTALRSVPRYTASTSARWTFGGGWLQGARLIGSVFTADERPGDSRDSFRLEGFTIGHLGLARAWQFGEQDLEGRLMLRNVADVEYYTASNALSSVVPGQPRTLGASVEWRF
jgi:iron complex outermembrane receptor protein